MEQLLSNEQRSANRQVFDLSTAKLRKQAELASYIKSEILGLKGRFAAMNQYFANAQDEVSPDLQQTYDIHISAFLHAVKMYLIITDPLGQPFFNPVTDEIKTTDIVIPIQFPHYTINQAIATIDNIWVDTTTISLLVGDQTLNCLSAAQITAQFEGMVTEDPVPYLSRREFLTGIAFEIEKLTIFHSRICLIEQKLTSAIKYISDLKSLGLY